MSISKPILEQTLDEYKKQLSVNGMAAPSLALSCDATHVRMPPLTPVSVSWLPVDGVVYCAKYVGEIFKRQNTGNLIITSSISASIVNVPVDQPVYNGTKAFVTQFGKSLAREWRDFARVNVISPGFFDTKMGAGPAALQEAYRLAVLGRQGHVREIKGLFLYLASDASSYTTGSDVLVDGGYVLT